MSLTSNLAGKIALVTGASKGIGKATALALAAAGSSVVINYNSDDQSANDLVHTIGAQKALAVKADCSTIAGIDTLVKQTIERFGRIDVLVANAGILPMKDLEHTTEEDFDRTFAINVKGPYFLAQVRTSFTTTPLQLYIATANGRTHHPLIMMPTLMITYRKQCHI